MDAIKLTAYVDESRRLVVDLPPDAPIGNVEVTIEAQSATEEADVTNLTPREIARAKLLAAGLLVTDIKAPEDAKQLTIEEIWELGTLPSGSPSVSEMIIRDRGEY